MFDESNLHSLIARESRLRRIPHGKLLRESLQAAADEKFTVRADSGLSPDWRERLRGLAAVAEAQYDWHWWGKPPWSELKPLLVKESEFLAWLDGATGATKHTTELPGGTVGAASPALKFAPDSKIDEAINAEYNIAEQKGLKPPNVKEIVAPVQTRLHAQGFNASGRQIQRVADADKHKRRRRQPGRTVTSEKRGDPG
jgi:hypothetical protein